MGFNTVAVLYNDHTHLFEASGHLGKRMADAMTSGWLRRDRDRMGVHFGSGQVVSQAHADYDQVVVVGKNTGFPIYEANDLHWVALKQMAECLERHGYKVKPPAKKRRAA